MVNHDDPTTDIREIIDEGEWYAKGPTFFMKLRNKEWTKEEIHGRKWKYFYHLWNRWRGENGSRSLTDSSYDEDRYHRGESARDGYGDRSLLIKNDKDELGDGANSHFQAWLHQELHSRIFTHQIL